MATNIFEDGDILWDHKKVDSSPKPLQVLYPTVPGAYPVIVFFHGFFIPNTSYNEMLGHIASHGYIIVAPKLFTGGFLPMFGPCEVHCAAQIVNWIAEGLQPYLPDNVEAQLDSLVLAGHSRGGKTAFAVALGKSPIKLNIKVLLGIDPVAGLNKCIRTLPEILTYKPESFNLEMPILVIGTGLGPEKANWFLWPCAPDGVNHKEFFKECKEPRQHFVTKEFGHLDMLDDKACTPRCECKGRKKHRDLMRKTIAGLVVAFLRAYLEAQFEDLDNIVNHPELAPTTLDEIEPPKRMKLSTGATLGRIKTKKLSMFQNEKFLWPRPSSKWQTRKVASWEATVRSPAARLCGVRVRVSV
ncbi:hypothetical protein PIB30_025768 [Stylosanthes scabra]|uniref:Chlorophyllase n=1 Tax=Stylosanthes scabra TaxID=79078 RepID=A0ABU6RAI6_9FABA|nr:hypothetical protein [Stylosanthes scabra]